MKRQWLDELERTKYMEISNVGLFVMMAQHFSECASENQRNSFFEIRYIPKGATTRSINLSHSTAILCRNETCSTHEEQNVFSYYLTDCISHRI
jgi:hypothetical protein